MILSVGDENSRSHHHGIPFEKTQKPPKLHAPAGEDHSVSSQAIAGDLDGLRVVFGLVFYLSFDSQLLHRPQGFQLSTLCYFIIRYNKKLRKATLKNLAHNKTDIGMREKYGGQSCHRHLLRDGRRRFSTQIGRASCRERV